MSKKGSFKFLAIQFSAHQILASYLTLMHFKRDLLLFLMPFHNNSSGVEAKYSLVTVTEQFFDCLMIYSFSHTSRIFKLPINLQMVHFSLPFLRQIRYLYSSAVGRQLDIKGRVQSLNFSAF